ncbi:hypothetical protein OQA88_11006 [Cercophora sp. LCS_1]
MTRSFSLLAIGSLASTALSHSFVSYVDVEGAHYNGYDPRPGAGNRGNRVVWSYNAPDQGWVNGSHYTTPDIACHRDAESAPAHAVIRAGQTVGVHWNGWPRIHKGPVLSYLAPCTGTSDGCSSVDKSQLKWTMIDDSAPVLISPDPSSDNGTWSSDYLTGVDASWQPTTYSNNTWQVRVPAGLQPGPYVLRNEIIALHYGVVPEEGGAQHYPVCINLFVVEPEGNTTPPPFGLVGVANGDLYEVGHPGLFYDIAARPMAEYVIPGPGIAAGATPVRYDLQHNSTIVEEGVPVRVEGTATVPLLVKRTAAAFAA